jgi:dTDP-4-amino-4,6-dideoxygalactose transaminase
MRVKFLNLALNNKIEKNKYIKLFEKFLSKGTFVLGKEVKNFEKNISRYINQKYTVGVSSGTNALYLALKSLDIKKNDEVIVPCLSWYSTFTAVAMTGAKPVGADIGEDYLIDIKDIKKKFNIKTKAIILVHFTGLIKNMEIIKEFCKKNRIFLVEDCAQAFGAIYKNKKAGSFGDVAAFSMNPMKVLSAFGDAGAVSTSNYKVYQKLKILRYAGVDMKKDECFYPDLNHKLDTLQALVLNNKLRKLNKIINRRIKNALYYDKNVSNKFIKPIFYKNYQNVYYTYSIRCSKRDQLVEFLKKKGVETKIQQKKLLNHHSGFQKYNNHLFKVGEKITHEILSIPIHEHLKYSEITYVTKQLNFFAKRYL